MLIADFLKANYFARLKFLLGNFAQVKGHKKPKKIKEMIQKMWTCGELCIFGFKNQNLAQFLNIFARPHGCSFYKLCPTKPFVTDLSSDPSFSLIFKTPSQWRLHSQTVYTYDQKNCENCHLFYISLSSFLLLRTFLSLTTLLASSLHF